MKISASRATPSKVNARFTRVTHRNQKSNEVWLKHISNLRLSAVDALKRYSKALEYEYRVKTAALDTLKWYSIFSLTLYLEWYCAYSMLYSDGAH
jgi:hypothetical protein